VWRYYVLIYYLKLIGWRAEKLIKLKIKTMLISSSEEENLIMSRYIKVSEVYNILIWYYFLICYQMKNTRVWSNVMWIMALKIKKLNNKLHYIIIHFYSVMKYWSQNLIYRNIGNPYKSNIKVVLAKSENNILYSVDELWKRIIIICIVGNVKAIIIIGNFKNVLKVYVYFSKGQRYLLKIWHFGTIIFITHSQQK